MATTAEYIVQNIQEKQIVAFLVENNSNAKNATIVLLAGIATLTNIEDSIVKIGTFKDLKSDGELTGSSSFDLENVKLHDSIISPSIDAILMEVVSSENQLSGCKKPLKIITQDRLGNEKIEEVNGIFDNELGKFVFPIAQIIHQNQYVTFELLPSLKVSFEVVYN